MTDAPPPWSSRSAEHNKVVYLTCDGVAFPYAYFFACQVLEKEQNRDFDVVIGVDDRAVIPNHLLAGAVRFMEVPIDPRIASLPQNRSISRAAYYRMMLLGAFYQDYARALYLDCDIYLRRAGLTKLLNADLQGFAAGAAPDFSEYDDRKGVPSSHQIAANLPGDQIYRNSGMLLVDVAQAVESDLMNRMITFRMRMGTQMKQLDQGALNGVLGKDMALISPLWNFMTLPQTRDVLDHVDPYLLHFVSHPKPWVDTPENRSDRYFSQYETFLTDVFGQDDLDKRGRWASKPARAQGIKGWITAWRQRQHNKRSIEKRRAQAAHVMQVDPHILRSLIERADIP